MSIYPPDVNLNTSRNYQSLIVQATYPDGTTRDVTSQVTWTLSDPKLGRGYDKNVLYPTADGQCQLLVEYAGRKLAIPVTVQNGAVDRPDEFRLDVMPVFMRAGCNVGSCHGWARGKDGFRLSLFVSTRTAIIMA